MSTWQSATIACSIGFLLSACSQQPKSQPDSTFASSLPGCQAAAAPTEFGNLLNIPDETKAAIETYRSHWRALCDTATTEARPTLAELLAEAKTIEMSFRTVFDDYIEAHPAEERLTSGDAISDLVVKQYPAFVPAFEGSFWEQEYFRPSTGEFRSHSSLGNEEDQLFFNAGIPLTTEFPEWIDRTWDYGGCLRFGSFAWTETLQRIVQAKMDLQSSIYKQLSADYESALINSISDLASRVCTCGRKEAVLEDLEVILAYLKTEPTLANYAFAVQMSIDGIHNNTIAVSSEAEAHCSGG